MGHVRRRSDGLHGEARHAKPLNQAIRELTESLGIRKTLSEYDVVVSWKDIVGEGIANVATPVRVEQGILLVQVSTAVWRNELSMRRLEILEKIHAHAGKRIVKDIRFR
jgi:predicted nucleic acid-binding Zn ribbon protein